MERAHKLLAWTNSLNWPARLLGATVVVGAVALIEWLSWPRWACAPYVLFFMAVIFTAILFAKMTSLYAAVLSSVVVVIAFHTPDVSADAAARLVAFILLSIFVSVIGEEFRRLIDALSAANNAKAVLLRELRHRTKNYLQMVGAAIRLAANDSKHDEVRASLESMALRVENIGQISKALDFPSSKGLFDAREYFEGLVSGLSKSLVDPKVITIVCRAEIIPIGRTVAETLGIAVNELITNAVKCFSRWPRWNCDSRVHTQIWRASAGRS